MSLQEEILKRRKTLNPTNTLVTTSSGKQFIEQHRTGQQQQLQSSSYGFVVDNKPDFEAACILNNFLYLGSQDAVSEANILNYKLTHILSVGIKMPTISEAHQLETIFIPCLDLPETQLFTDNGTGVAQQAVIAISNMLKTTSGQARIFVHCNAGVSRSASVVICYLMMHCGMCFDDAYALVKQKRPAIQPNIGFMRQMRQFSNCKS